MAKPHPSFRKLSVCGEHFEWRIMFVQAGHDYVQIKHVKDHKKTFYNMPIIEDMDDVYSGEYNQFYTINPKKVCHWICGKILKKSEDEIEKILSPKKEKTALKFREANAKDKPVNFYKESRFPDKPILKRRVFGVFFKSVMRNLDGELAFVETLVNTYDSPADAIHKAKMANYYPHKEHNYYQTNAALKAQYGNQTPWQVSYIYKEIEVF